QDPRREHRHGGGHDRHGHRHLDHGGPAVAALSPTHDVVTSSKRVYVASPPWLSSWLVSVSVYTCPAVTAAVTCTQPAPFVHVFASGVVVTPVVSSLSVAVAQSWATTSAQVRLYQNDSCVAPAGAPNVWASEESPLVGDVLPTR